MVLLFLNNRFWVRLLRPLEIYNGIWSLCKHKIFFTPTYTIIGLGSPFFSIRQRYACEKLGLISSGDIDRWCKKLLNHFCLYYSAYAMLGHQYSYLCNHPQELPGIEISWLNRFVETSLHLWIYSVYGFNCFQKVRYKKRICLKLSKFSPKSRISRN